MRLAFALSLLSVLGADAAVAQTATPLTAIVGKPLKVDWAISLNPDCSLLGYPDYRFVSEPRNGTTSIRQGKDFTSYPTSNPYHVCNGRAAPSTQLWYTSEKGFSGQDEFTVLVVFRNGGSGKRTYKINVVP